MTDPGRLSDDHSAPPELRALLQNARSARPLDPVVRERAHARVARAAALPITAAGWLSVKTAVAAFGVGCGTAVVAVIVTSPGSVPHAAPVSANAAVHQAIGPLQPSRRAQTAALEPAVDPVVPSPSARAPSSAAAFPHQEASSSATDPAGGASALSEESALLERARSALRRAPLESLRLVREHAERFPKAQLGAERALIEVEALHRLGRDGEAKNLAQALLTRSADDLYAERVRALLAEISPK